MRLSFTRFATELGALQPLTTTYNLLTSPYKPLTNILHGGDLVFKTWYLTRSNDDTAGPKFFKHPYGPNVFRICSARARKYWKLPCSVQHRYLAYWQLNLEQLAYLGGCIHNLPSSYEVQSTTSTKKQNRWHFWSQNALQNDAQEAPPTIHRPCQNLRVFAMWYE